MKFRHLARNRFFNQCRSALFRRARRTREVATPSLAPVPVAAFFGVETLEPRIAPAVAVAFNAGVLSFTGDSLDNQVVIRADDTSTTVEYLLDGQTTFTEVTGVNQILFFGGKGDDHLVVINGGGNLFGGGNGIGFAGEDGNDIITLSGGSAGVSGSAVFTGPQAGTVTYANGAATERLAFDSVAKINDLMTASGFYVVGSDSNNVVNVVNGPNLSPTFFGTQGPVLLDGGDRDDHGSNQGGPNGDENEYGWEFIEEGLQFLSANQFNASATKDILAVGVTGDVAKNAIVSAAAKAGLGVEFVSGGAISSVDIDAYRILYVPSDAINTKGGITQNDLNLLNGRAGEITQFIKEGGGVFGLSESNLTNQYGWLQIGVGFTTTTSTSNAQTANPSFAAAGFTMSNEELSDAAPLQNAFTGPAGFNGLDVFVENGTDQAITLGRGAGDSKIDGGQTIQVNFGGNSTQYNVANKPAVGVYSGTGSSTINANVTTSADGLQDLVLSGGNPFASSGLTSYRLTALPAGLDVKAVSNSGGAHIVVGYGTNSLDGIKGNLTLIGSSADDEVTFLDTAQSLGHEYNVSRGLVSRVGGPSIDLGQFDERIDRIYVSGGSGDDTFTVQPSPLSDGFSSKATIEIFGNNPTQPTGDRLVYQGSGSLTLGNQTGAGTITNAAQGDVRYNGIETVEATGTLSRLTVTTDLLGAGASNDGFDDAWEIRGIGEDFEIYLNGVFVFGGSISSFERLDFIGSNDNDTLTIDSTLGGLVFGDRIEFTGGGGFDTLILNGNASGGGVYSVGPALDAGTVTYDFGGNQQTVHFTGLEPVIDNVVAPSLVVQATAADNAITLRQSTTPGYGAVFVDGFEHILFQNKPILTLAGLGGSDTVSVLPVTVTGLSEIQIKAGSPTANGDQVILTGTSAQENVAWDILADQEHLVTGFNSVPIRVIEAEHITMDGRGGNDTLTLTTAAGVDQVTFRVGDAGDNGTIEVAPFAGTPSRLQLAFENFGAAGSLSFKDASGAPADYVDYYGSETSEFISIDNAGKIVGQSLLGQTRVNVFAPGATLLHVHGLGASDQLSVAADQPYDFLTWDGGEGNDRFDILGSAAGDTLNVGHPEASVVVGSNNLSYLGTERVFITLGGGGADVVNFKGSGRNTTSLHEITISGGPEDQLNFQTTGSGLGLQEIIEVTPGALGDGALQWVGSPTQIRFQNFENGIKINAAAADAKLIVHGTNGADSFTITDTLIDGIGLTPVAIQDFASVHINGGDGADLFELTPSANVQFSFDGGNPQGVGGGDILAIDATSAGLTVRSGAFAGQGVVEVAGKQAVSFTDLSLSVINSGNLIIEGTSGDDEITITGVGAGTITASVNGGPVATYEGVKNLQIEAREGQDRITVAGLSAANGLTGVTVNGDVSGVDELIVVGLTGSADRFAMTPTGARAGLVDNPGKATITYSGISSVTVTGQSVDGDAITFEDTAGNDIIEAYVASAGQGEFRGRTFGSFEFVPVKYSGFISEVGLVETAAGGVDEAYIIGTAGDDLIEIKAGLVATVEVNDAAILVNKGFASITLDGRQGNDITVVNEVKSTLFGGTIKVVGGDSDLHTDELIHVAAASADTTIDYTTFTITSTGTATVTFSGVERIQQHSKDVGSSLTFIGSLQDDALTYTPLGLFSGRVTGFGGLASTYPQVYFQGVDTEITITGGLAGNDTLTVNGTAVADKITVDDKNVAFDGALKPIVYEGFEDLRVMAGSGADEITVTPSAATSIFVDGGDPIGNKAGDRLIVNAGGNAVSLEAGPEKDEGGVKVAGSQTISFDHIEEVIVKDPGLVLITGTNGDDDITIIARDDSTHPFLAAFTPGEQDFTVSVNDGMDFLLVDAPVLFIDALAGDDDVVLRAPAPNQAAWNVEVNLVGGSPSAISGDQGDVFVFETPGDSTVVYTPSGPDTGSVLLDQTKSSTINLLSSFTIPELAYTSSTGGFEQFAYDAENSGDDFTIVGSGSSETIRHIPGNANDEGSFRVGDRLAVSYQNFTIFGSLTVDGGGGLVDTLLLEGTGLNDTFTVDAFSGAVDQNLRLPVNVTNVDNLTLVGHDGDDIFNLPSGYPYSGISIQGGNPSKGSDVINLTADPGAANFVTIRRNILELSNQTITGLGGAIQVSGAELIRFEGDGDDLLTVETGAQDDAVRLEGGLDLFGYDRLISSALPTIEFTGLDDFLLDVGLGVDVVTIATWSLMGVVDGDYNVDTEYADTLVIEGTNGGGTQDDQFLLEQYLGAVLVTHSNSYIPGVTVNSDVTARLIFNTLDGNDTLKIDVGTSGELIGTPVTFNGGRGSDRLEILGTPATPVDEAIYTLNPLANSGTISYEDAGNTTLMRVEFTDLEPVIDLVPATTLTVKGTNADNAINYREGSIPANALVSVDDNETVEFSNKTNLVIDGLGGNDTIHLQNNSVPTGLTNIFVNGGSPNATGDTLVYSGRDGVTQENIRLLPTAAEAGQIFNGTAPAAPLVTYTGVDKIRFDLQYDEDDVFALDGTAGDDLVQIFSGLSPGVMTIHGVMNKNNAAFALPEVLVENALAGGLSGIFNFSGVGGIDAFEYSGLAGDDTFDLATTVGITSLSHFANGQHFQRIGFGNAESITIHGLNGDDTFNIDASTPLIDKIVVQGGNPDASDVLNIKGSTGAETITVAIATSTISGFGSDVVFSSIEDVNIDGDGGGDTLTFDGTALADEFTYTPTAPQAGLVSVKNVHPQFAFVDIDGDFTINGGALGDTLTVVGSNGVNDIVATDKEIKVDALKPVKLTALEAVTLRGLEGSDKFTVTPSAILPFFVDGNDPIGNLPGDQLVLLAGADSVTFDPGPEPDSGGFIVGANLPVSYDHLESITVTNPGGGPLGPVLIDGTNGADAITIIARDTTTHPGADGVQDYTIAVNGSPDILFLNSPVLVVNALHGSDEIVLRTPAPNGVVWGTATTIIGGEPSGSDTLLIETPNANVVTYTPTSSDDATMLIDDVGVPIIITDVEHLVYDGESETGADDFTIIGSGGNDNIVHTPAQFGDAGRLRVESWLPVDYQNLGFAATLKVDGAGGTDTFFVEGTQADNVFSVNTKGDVTITGRLALTHVNYERLVLQGFGGNDTFNIDSTGVSLPFEEIIVESGDGTGADVVNMLGNGTDVALTIGAVNGGAFLTGGGFSTKGVTLTGSEVLNLNTGAGKIDVLGTAGPNFFDVTPTHPTKSTLFAVGFSPIVNTDNTGLLTIVDGAANDGDSVTIHGTTQDDQIVINRTDKVTPTDASVLVNALKLINVRTANVEALMVRGELGGDTFHVFGGGGPRLTVHGNQPLSRPQSDTLVVHGAAGLQNAFTYVEGQTTDSGSVQLANKEGDDVTQFQGIEDVILEAADGGAGDLPDTATFIANNADNDIVLTILGGKDASLTLDAQPNVLLNSFSQGSIININSLAGDDEISLVIATPNVTNFTKVNVDGGQPTASDTLIVNGVPLHNDALQVQPQGTGKGMIIDNTAAFPEVNFLAIEHLKMVGQSSIEDDALLENLGPSNNTLVYTPGLSPDSGTITGFTNGDIDNFAFVPITFSGFLGFIVAPNVVPAPGTHTLIVNGTAGDDTFGFGDHVPFGPALASINVNTGATPHTPVYFSNALTRVILRGLEGNDLFDLDFNPPSTSTPVIVRVEGGDSDASSDTILHTAAPGAETQVNIDGTIVSTQANFVEFSGVELISHISTGAGSTLRVVGTAGQDQIEYSPTGATAGRVTESLHKFLLEFTGVQSNFIISSGNNHDTVTVHGTVAANVIDVVRGSQTKVQVDTLKAVLIETGNTESITVAGGLGDDAFTVSGVDGALPGVHGPLIISGGSPNSTSAPQGDSLVINVPAGATTVVPGTESNSGVVNSPHETDVVFDSIDYLTINGSNPAADVLTVLGTSGHDNFAALATKLGNEVFVNDRTPVRFTNFLTLNLDGRTGDDFFSITHAGLSLNSINVTGGDPTASDTLLVNGTTGADVVTFSPLTAGAGSVAITGLPLINFNTTEHVKYNGLGGNDKLGVVTPAGAQDIVYTAGPTDDSGSVQIESLVSFDFLQLGPNGAITISDVSGARVDALTYSGGDGDDVFTFNAGVVTLNGRLAPAMPGVANLTLNGYSGNDTFNVTGSGPFTSLTLAGGDPSTGDVANLTGDGTTANVTLDTKSSVTGGGLGSVFLSGVESANLTNGAGAVNILGTAGSDNLTVEPTTASAAKFNSSASPLVLTTTTTGDLTVDTLGGVDLVKVLGNIAANNATVTLGLTTKVAIDALKTVGFKSASVEALHLLTGDGVDTITVTGTGGAPLTVDAGSGNDIIDASAVTKDGLTLIGGTGSDSITAGAGADLILGGDGNDSVVGGAGNDTFFGGEGSDLFTWNPGDGSDLLEGEGGTNVLVFKGSAANEVFALTAKGTRAELTRDLGSIVMDIADFQQIDLITAGGADAVTVGDLMPTAVDLVNVDLDKASALVSKVTVIGTAVANQMGLAPIAPNTFTVDGLPYGVHLQGVLPADQVTLNGGLGNDTLTAAPGIDALVQLTLDGGEGDDVLTGGVLLRGGAGHDTLTGDAGANTIEGGDGNDLLIGLGGDDSLFGGAGDDRFIGGAGADVLDGGDGIDSVEVDGTLGADKIEVRQTDASTLLWALNGALETESITAMESVTVNALAGDDLIQVVHNDSLVATPAASLRVIVAAGESVVGDRLVVLDDGLGDTMIHRQGQLTSTGSIQVGPLASVYFTGVEFVQPVSGGVDGFGQLVIFRHDGLEPNDTKSTAAHLGAGQALNFDVTIDPSADPIFGAPTDQDFFRVQSLSNGFLNFRVFFQKLEALPNGRAGLPGGGDLIVEVYDSNGVLRDTGTASTFGSEAGFATLAGEVYYLRVRGATPDAINSYDVTVTNKALPPFNGGGNPGGPGGGGNGGPSAFTAAVNYPMGKQPRGVTVGDVNGDGNLDMVTANTLGKSIGVRLGKGDGTFEAPVNFPTGGKAPMSVVLVDLDNDGNLDAMVANRNSNELAQLMGDGLGGFGEAIAHRVDKTARPISIRAADVNNDGNADIVVANQRSRDVSVMLGTGTGNFFVANAHFTGGRGIRDVVVGDFNGDGNADIVSSNAGSKNISFLPGDGAGNFGPAVLFSTGARPVALTTGDFDNDNNLDVAVANSSGRYLTVFRGTGFGGSLGFEEQIQVQYPRKLKAQSIAAGDFNFDGKLDLVLSNFSDNDINVLLGNGNGTFSEPFDFRTGRHGVKSPQSIVVADLNNDGLPDIVVANHRSDDVSILLRNATI